MLATVAHDDLAAALDGGAQALGVMLDRGGLFQVAGARAAAGGRLVVTGWCAAVVRGFGRWAGAIIGLRGGLRALAALLAVQSHGGLRSGWPDERQQGVADRLDGKLAGDLAGMVAAHAVRHDEEPRGLP